MATKISQYRKKILTFFSASLIEHLDLLFEFLTDYLGYEGHIHQDQKSYGMRWDGGIQEIVASLFFSLPQVSNRLGIAEYK